MINIYILYYRKFTATDSRNMDLGEGIVYGCTNPVAYNYKQQMMIGLATTLAAQDQDAALIGFTGNGPLSSKASVNATLLTLMTLT